MPPPTSDVACTVIAAVVVLTVAPDTKRVGATLQVPVTMEAMVVPAGADWMDSVIEVRQDEAASTTSDMRARTV